MTEKKKFRTTGLHLDTVTLDKINKGVDTDFVPAGDILTERDKKKDYHTSLMELKEKCKAVTKGDFFIESVSTFDPMYHKSLRHQHFSRDTCPGPRLGSNVYHYKRATDTLEVLWQLPMVSQVIMYKQKRMLLQLNEQQKHIMEYVDRFEQGQLHPIVTELNKERELNPHIVLRVENGK